MARETFTLRRSGGANISLYVDYTESTNIAANTSTITITALTLHPNSFSNFSGRLYGSISINGTQVWADYYNVRADQTLSISTQPVTVSHNSDGSGSFTLGFGPYQSGWHNFYVNVTEDGNAEYGITETSRSIALTTLPRASTIASAPGSANTLDSYSLSMDRKSSAFYHWATFSSGGKVLYTSGGFASSLSFTIPREWFNGYPNSTTLSITVAVQTYSDSSGSTAVGDAQYTSFTLYADAGMKPSVASGWATAAPVNGGSAAGMSGYIQGVSRARVTFTPSKIGMANNATLVGYEIKMGGNVDRTEPYETDIISATSAAIVCTVTDSRGRTASETLAIEAMPYTPPSISAVNVFRCTEDGTKNDDGTYYSVTATLYTSSLNGQNSGSMTVQRATASGSYGTDGSLASGTAKVFGGLNVDSTYKIRIRATDTLGNTTDFVSTLPSRAWAMKFRPTGNGVAFGKAAERDKALELPGDWNLYIGDTTVAKGGFGYGGENTDLVGMYGKYDSEATMNAKLNEIGAAMNLNSTKQFSSSFYPFFSGTTWTCTLYKTDNDWQVFEAVSYQGYGARIRKCKYNGAWQPIEWENPPMEEGKEYRTTERRNGRVVYTKLINCGAAANGKAVNSGANNIFRHSGSLGIGSESLPYASRSGQTWWAESLVSSGSTLYLFCSDSFANGGYTWYEQIWYMK